MFLGIEIGGTKLQFGVGPGDSGSLTDVKRLAVEPKLGAEGIRRQLEEVGVCLIRQHGIRAVGIGFGGPVDAAAGRTITSHQIDGWDDFPLANWCREQLGLPVVVANDSDSAGLAEARFGAGQGHRAVLYTNVGSGIGGALVIEGEIYRGGSGTAIEPGHLRPGLQSDRPDQTVESIASGWAITAAVRERMADPMSQPLRSLIDESRPRGAESVRRRLIEREEADEKDAADLRRKCEGQLDRLSTKIIAQAAEDGNQLARDVFDRACQAYGWAIAQVITLTAPNIVVVGGGVSLAGEKLFFAPLRRYVDRYGFPPRLGTFKIVPAQLGEEVVVHGALALASKLAQ